MHICYISAVPFHPFLEGPAEHLLRPIREGAVHPGGAVRLLSTVRLQLPALRAAVRAAGAVVGNLQSSSEPGSVTAAGPVLSQAAPRLLGVGDVGLGVPVPVIRSGSAMGLF